MRFLRALPSVSQLGLYISMAAIFAIMVLVTLDVVLRNVTGRSIYGSMELSEFLQGIAVFFGIAATMRAGGHIAADFLVERLAPRTRMIIDLCMGLLSFALFALMTYALWTIATGPGSGREISSTLGIPTRPFRLLATFGIALLCYEILRQVLINGRRLLRGDVS